MITPKQEEILRTNCKFYEHYDDATKSRYLKLVSAFLDQMVFQGENIEVTDEMRVTVAGWAVRIILNAVLGLTLYKHITLIKIYDDCRVNENALGLVNPGYFYCHIHLAWKNIQKNLEFPYGDSVIIHEFAHALDLIDREIDGNASLLMLDENDQKKWDATFKSVFNAGYILNRSSKRQVRKLWDYFKLGRWRKFDPSDLSCVVISELFAVASERFFLNPHSLKKVTPEIYDLLVLLYKQNTLEAVLRSPIMMAWKNFLWTVFGKISTR